MDCCTTIARRHFLKDCGIGLGKVALASLLGGSTLRADDRTDPLSPKQPHYRAKAKAVIHLFMSGAPSHLDLFDYKPKLKDLEVKPLPPSIIGTQRFAFIRGDAGVLAPQFKFAKHGRSGAEIADTLPHLAKVVDDVCFIRSVHTEATKSSHPSVPTLRNTAVIGSRTRTLR